MARLKSTRSPTKYRVLVVDDDADFAQSTARLVAREGHEVSVLTDATRCLEHIQQWRPNILLLDYHLGEMTGDQVVRQIREVDRLTQVVLVTGYATEHPARRLLADLDIQLFHDKADGPERLLVTLDAVLKHYSALTALEQQVLASERMAAMGTLAAGVAHEINNPLAALVANLHVAVAEAQTLTERLGDASELHECLRDAQEAAERVRHIAQDLKVFSHSGNEPPGPVDPHRVLDSTLRLAWSEIRRRAQLVKAYGDVPPIEANEARLGQVLLNLVLNAAQSIPEGEVDRNTIRIATRPSSTPGFVELEVSDTGSGMPPEVREKLFQPFFTTKPVGVGTGLGLSICSRIVTSYGGRIEVESEVGRGSTFRVLLPVAKGTAAATEPP